MRHRFRASAWCGLFGLAVACGGGSRDATEVGGRSAGASAAISGGSGNAGVRADAGARAGAGGAAVEAGSREAGKSGSAGAADGGGGAVAGARSTPAAGGGGTAGSTQGDSLVPKQGALLGEYYGDGTVAASDARIGRKPTLHLVYYAWKDDWSSELSNDFSAGKIPLVNWEPDGIDFHDIVSGKLDATIQARAAGAKAAGAKFFLDFAAEMNADEAWSGNDPKLYVDAYHHLHDLFSAAGASNVVWAWCPNVTDTDGRNSTTMSYYPGDAYVDWSCVDGYNWGQGSGFDWQSFHDVFKDIYPLLAALSKPILIGEMASDEQGGDKAAWVDAIIPTLKSSYPMIKGLVWFDVKKERDWEIDSSPTSLAAYQRFAADAYLNP